MTRIELIDSEKLELRYAANSHLDFSDKINDIIKEPTIKKLKELKTSTKDLQVTFTRRILPEIIARVENIN